MASQKRRMAAAADLELQGGDGGREEGKGASVTEGPRAPIPRSEQQHPLKGEPIPLIILFPQSTILMERSLPQGSTLAAATELRTGRPAGSRGVSIHPLGRPELQPGRQALICNSADGTWVLPLPLHLKWDREKKNLNHSDP